MHSSKIACIITAQHGEQRWKANTQTSRDLLLSHLQTDKGSQFLSYKEGGGEFKTKKKQSKPDSVLQNIFPHFSFFEMKLSIVRFVFGHVGLGEWDLITFNWLAIKKETYFSSLKFETNTYFFFSSVGLLSLKLLFNYLWKCNNALLCCANV